MNGELDARSDLVSLEAVLLRDGDRPARLRWRYDGLGL